MHCEVSVKAEEPTAQTGFLRKVAILSGATALGQVLSFAASPLLTRLFTPTDFGISGTFSVLVGLLQVVASARYENAIPLPRSTREGLRLVLLCLTILLMLVSLTLLVVWLGGQSLWLPQRLESIRPQLVFLPWGILGVGLFVIAEFWAIRQSYFAELSKTRVWQGMASLSVQLACGYGHWGARGLIIAFLVGQSAGGLRLWKLLLRDLKQESERLWDRTELTRLAARYRSFPLVTVWAALGKIAGLYFPMMFFSVHFGQEATGWLALAQRILGLPLILVGEAVSRAYLSAAARLRGGRQHQDHERLFWKVVLGQTALGLLVLLPGLLLAPWAFSFFFGSVWRQAGVFALYSGLGLLAQLIVTPVHCQLDVAERQKLSLLGECFRWFCLLAGAALVIKRDLNATQCAFVLGLGSALAQGFIFCLCWWSLKADRVPAMMTATSPELERAPSTVQS